MMVGDDNQIRFYTALSLYAIFETLLNLKLFSEVIPTASTGCGLGCSDPLPLVLTKLKLAVPNQVLDESRITNFTVNTAHIFD